jgi:hypothetical protein
MGRDAVWFADVDFDECFKQGLQCATLQSSLHPLAFGECFNYILQGVAMLISLTC